MQKTFAIEIKYRDAFGLFSQFAHRNGAIFLDSSSQSQGQGRYSFIAFDPVETFTLNSPLDFQVMTERARELKREALRNIPPFQGGLAGYLGYELQQFFEKLPQNQSDEFSTYKGFMGLYAHVISFDHQKQKAWVVGDDQNFAQRLANQINKSPHVDLKYTPCELEWSADFDQKEYEAKVQKVIDYILEGDIFQANLTQKFKAVLPDKFNPLALYGNLRKGNPAPFSAYLNLGVTKIACSSPERFLELNQQQVTSHPIKGTRPRFSDLEQDRAMARELLNSEKDLAENTMIVDLLRNDLSRVCVPHSVNVPELCKLHSFATVHHLISKICGQLSATMDGFDLIKATFPGGSITGAPKVRAMEIITEIEKGQRGPYCGSIGYMDLSGNMDLNIVIRSLLFKDNKVCIQVGGGIVADSDPASEYQETLDKADALFNAFKARYL